MPRRRLAPQETAPTATPVRSRKPDPLAWSTALGLAGGDVRRLVVESPTTILVKRTA